MLSSLSVLPLLSLGFSATYFRCVAIQTFVCHVISTGILQPPAPPHHHQCQSLASIGAVELIALLQICLLTCVWTSETNCLSDYWYMYVLLSAFNYAFLSAFM